MLGLGLSIIKTAARAAAILVAEAAQGLYRQPDGLSRYKQPNGISDYIQP